MKILSPSPQTVFQSTHDPGSKQVWFIRHFPTGVENVSEDSDPAPWPDERLRELSVLCSAVSVVFYSRTRRCAATIRALPLRHSAKESCDLINPMDWGAFKGLPYLNVAAGMHAVFEKWKSGNFDAAPPGGESFTAVLGRLRLFISRLPGDAGRILVCTHSSVIRALVWQATGYIAQEEEIKTLAIAYGVDLGLSAAGQLGALLAKTS